MANEARWCETMRCIAGGPQESTKGCNNHIHCLGDDLLMEILRRLPNCKSVIRCKSVCKRWAAVASQPCFIGQFIGLRFDAGAPSTRNGGTDLNKEHQNFAIVMWYVPHRYNALLNKFESSFKDSIFLAEDSSFDSLHGLGDDNASVKVVASCNDLLLYSKHENEVLFIRNKIRISNYDYYISNVQTRQWVKLPLPPFHHGPFHVGFICDPYYSYDMGILINAAYHYSVVVLNCTSEPSDKFNAHIFSSHHDSQWRDRVLSLPKSCALYDSGSGFCFDGKLLFTCAQGIFGFNHNSIELDSEIQCHLVEWPVGMLLGLHRVGVSLGNLHVSALDTRIATLNVWLLKDYEASNWMLQHTVKLHEWVSRDSWMIEKLKWSSSDFPVSVDVLGYNPSCSDVIYLLVPGCIFSCNLLTRTVELACRIPVASRSKHNLRSFSLSLILQSWPTPVPSLNGGSTQVRLLLGDSKVGSLHDELLCQLDSLPDVFQ